MRILIQTLGSAGDVHPFLGIGQALAARGHEVIVFANEVFGETIEKAGLEHVPVGSADWYHEATANPDLWHPRKGLALVMNEGVVPSLGEYVDRMTERVNGETIVIGSTLGFAARMLRELHAVTFVTAHLAPAALRSDYRAPQYAGLWTPAWTPRWQKQLAWWLVDKIVDRMVCPGLNAFRRERGLPAIHRPYKDWIHSPDCVLALYPDWFAPRQPDWPASYVATAFPLFDGSSQREKDEALRAWLDGGTPPIVFTAGSAHHTAHTFFAESKRACERLGCRGVFVTGNAESVPAPLPGAIRHVAYAPFSRLLPKAAALVSHAGIGTCSQALGAGIPHLAVPRAFDQFDNASRLVDLGTGASLSGKRYTGQRAAKAIDRLIGSASVNGACASAARRVGEVDALEMICAAIERAVRG